VYEFSSAGDAAEVCHDVVGDDKQYRQREPYQAVVYIVHDILELPHRKTQYHDRPTELIQLEFNVTRLHCRNRHDERPGVHPER